MAATSATTRREFMMRLAGLGALFPLPGRLVGQDVLPRRTIPVSGEMLPVVGLGSTQAVLDIPTESVEPLVRVMRKLVDLGGRVVDTSPRSEEIDREFGRVLQRPEFQDRLFVTAKINTQGEQDGINQMRHSQRLFGRRTLDLVQVESLRGVETHWPNLRSWKDSGEARYIGVTVSNNSDHDRLESFMRTASPDFVHVNYSVMETAAENRLLPLASDLGMAVLTNRPFMNGGYFQRVAGRVLPEWAADFDCQSWAQFSLKYVLAHPAVTCALTETTNPAHMEENIHAAFGRLPDEAMKQRMRDLVGQF